MNVEIKILNPRIIGLLLGTSLSLISPNLLAYYNNLTSLASQSSCTGCHNGTALPLTAAAITITDMAGAAVTKYALNTQYRVTVDLQPGTSPLTPSAQYKTAFLFTYQSLGAAGTLAQSTSFPATVSGTNNSATGVYAGRGTTSNVNDLRSLQFNWTSPTTNIGTVNFRLLRVQADGNNSENNLDRGNSLLTLSLPGPGNVAPPGTDPNPSPSPSPGAPATDPNSGSSGGSDDSSSGNSTQNLEGNFSGQFTGGCGLIQGNESSWTGLSLSILTLAFIILGFRRRQSRRIS